MEDLASSVEQVLLASALAIPSADDRDGPIRWAPGVPAEEALRLLGGLEHRSAADRPWRLALAAGQLFGAARSAYWPIAQQGELDVSADEKPAVVLWEAGITIDQAWLREPVREAIRGLRRAVTDLQASAARLALANPETVTLGQVERVAYPALDLAVHITVLAIRQDPELLSTIDSRAATTGETTKPAAESRDVR
jgi:hypothetical protein